MSSAKSNKTADEALALASGFVCETRAGRRAWFVDCSCGASFATSLTSPYAPAKLAEGARKKGWSVSEGKTPLCPNCLKGNRMTGPDPKLARRIYALLDDHFDEAKKLYRPGWSDEKIAKELDVSQEIVVAIRTAAYGELAEDPQVTALRDDIELLRMEFSDSLAKMQADFAAKMSAVEQRLPSKHKKAAG